MSTPYPIILAGQRAQVMRIVIELSKPECEPLHAVLSTEAGVAEIPPILRGEKPTSTDPQAAELLGSHDYSKGPVAIILGGGYEDADAKVMRDACKGCLNVPWLMFDKNKPVGVELGPEYARIVMGRAKELLRKLDGEGKLGKDGIHYY